MNNTIRRLRIIALLLFITPTISLVGSLLMNNYLSIFIFDYGYNYNFKENIPGSTVRYLCSKENNFCSQKENENEIIGGIELKKNKTLGKCNLYLIKFNYVNESGNKIIIDNTKDLKSSKEKYFLQYKISDKINQYCIINSSSKYLYNFFPYLFEGIYKLKNHEKTTLGVANPINPFIYGEASISNIVKRFPISFFFKPLLYLSVIFMIIYWLYYNKILKELNNSTKNYYFFSFGMLSAFFLLLHVTFLGWTFENEILTKLRRTYVIFFILFEVLAQAFLIKKIFSMKERIANYLNLFIVYSKLIFVMFICITTLIILAILMIYSLDSKFDFILEWNYFLVLLFFYFLSFLMWKKLN